MGSAYAVPMLPVSTLPPPSSSATGSSSTTVPTTAFPTAPPNKRRGPASPGCFACRSLSHAVRDCKDVAAIKAWAERSGHDRAEVQLRRKLTLAEGGKK